MNESKTYDSRQKFKIYAITAKNLKLASTQFLKMILLNPLYLELV